MTDTDGNLVHAVIHSGGVQNREGIPVVLAEIVRRHALLRHDFADSDHIGDKLRRALRKIGKWTVEIFKRSDHTKSYGSLPRRCVVERTFAGLGRNRLIAKRVEQTSASTTAWLFMTSIVLFARCIERA